MPGRKRLKRPHPDGLVRKARAGVIAESDWLAVEIRARFKETAHTLAAAKKCIRLGRHATDELKVMELLKHIRRYCDWHTLEYHELDLEAGRLYFQEMTEEQPRGWWLRTPDPRRPV